MMKIVRRPYGAAIFLLLVAFASCDKPEEELGINLQPEEELLLANTTDTFTLKAYTHRDDSLPTGNYSTAVLGAYQDPVFGFAKASHITQLIPSSASLPNFADTFNREDIVVDSVVLSLRYQTNSSLNFNSTGIFGNPGQQYMQVFEVTEDLSENDTYYADTEVSYSDTDLVKENSHYFVPSSTDSVMVGESMQAPQIRIRLQESLGQRFISNTVGTTFTESMFIEDFKGLYITVDETKFNTANSGLLYLNSGSGTSVVTMYYRTPVDTLSYNFEILSNTYKYNKYEHDYANADRKLYQQLNGDESLGQESLYVQSMGGTRIHVDLPYIAELAESNYAVNKGELIVPFRGYDRSEIFSPAERIFPYAVSSDGQIYQVVDHSDAEASPYMGGYVNVDQNYYRINITRHIQNLILGNIDNNGIELVSTRAAISGDRTIINGPEYSNPEDPENRMRLVVTFTKF